MPDEMKLGIKAVKLLNILTDHTEKFKLELEHSPVWVPPKRPL